MNLKITIDFFITILFIASISVLCYADEGCLKNEVYKFCGNECEPTCLNKNQLNCATTCSLDFGCTCDDGYVRDSENTNNCIPLDSC
ncbi:venom serine protease inhibitor-like [Aphidius gifuensis]|uniref:venom serine protease inhibitor-like n=1 Tax=Aphidius gifuensis TaxID=684658 RepID=UPI001CDC4B0E|nr:venom serine protease inhibitor-like [Aphidius gifuensis]